jgi:hypothetical protein
MDAKTLLSQARSLKQETTSMQARTKLERAIHALEIAVREPAVWTQVIELSSQVHQIET